MRTAMRALNIPRCKHRLWSPACSHRTRLQSTVLSAVRQMFVQRINQVTGDAEWVVVEDPGKFMHEVSCFAHGTNLCVLWGRCALHAVFDQVRVKKGMQQWQ